VTKARQAGSSQIRGDDAFRLSDTYGFPLDLTQLLARERGFTVDEADFSRLLEEQRERSRGAGKAVKTIADLSLLTNDTDTAHSIFVGYEMLAVEHSKVVGISGEFLLLEQTPFYAESGGQVGDTGEIRLNDQVWRIVDTQRDGDSIAHKVEGPVGDILGVPVSAGVDTERRLAIMRNHTATHIVHEALRRVLGDHLHQAGSLVAPDHLRFDFTHFEKITPDRLAAIEDLVNQKIGEAINVIALNDPKEWVSIEEAKKRWPNVKMFFGEKYGHRVRVVEIDPGFSVELCGGTHVMNTREIGYFRFRSEGSVASGVRRIEAVTHDAAKHLLNLQDRSLAERIDFAEEILDVLNRLLGELRAAGIDTSEPAKRSQSLESEIQNLKGALSTRSARQENLGKRFQEQDRRIRTVEDLVLKLMEERKSAEKEIRRIRLTSASESMDTMIRNAVRLNGIKLVAARVQAASMDELKALGDSLRSRLGSGVGLLASIVDEKVALVCVVTDDLVASKTLEAGKTVGAVARLVGGGGGGRPHMATAGGKDVGRLDEALRSTEAIVRSFLNH
ncbi:MAG: alanine--tRNA ligase-related protein, partial [Bacteroidota bacterium]